MQKYQQEIERYIDGHRQEILDLWKEIVNLEGRADERDNLILTGKRLKEAFEETGMVCKLVDTGPDAAPYLTGILGADRPGKPVFFGGHFDTVFKKGKYGDEPFYIEDGKAHGPGCLDMKGGIIISLFVIKALESIGYDQRPIKICYVSDEEIGHEFAVGGGAIIQAEAEGALCGFNMETGLIDNALCIGRKAAVSAKVVITGVESHAGNDFTAGRNSIEEMAHKILELQKLTNLEEGTTVNCGVIHGGTVHNAVPGRCEMEVDMRFLKNAELEKTIAAAQEICRKTWIDGTSTEFTYRVSMPAYETIPGVLTFYDFACEIARKWEYPVPGSRVMGGGSDAAYVTMAGVPVICSFGVRGENNHTDREYAVVESMFDRAKFIAAIIANLDRYQG